MKLDNLGSSSKLEPIKYTELVKYTTAVHSYEPERDKTQVLLGKDIHTGKEVWISQKDRRSSLYMLGSTGSGKSVLISHMCAQDMRQKIRFSDEDEFPIGLCVIAPDKDIFDAILARVPASRE